MRTVYICHPIKGDKINNIVNIVKIVRAINLFLPDVVPITNYIADCLAMNDDVESEREKGLLNDEFILKSGIVDELWVFGDNISSGMQLEINIAQKIGIVIRYFPQINDVQTIKNNRDDYKSEGG